MSTIKTMTNQVAVDAMPTCSKQIGQTFFEHGGCCQRFWALSIHVDGKAVSSIQLIFVRKYSNENINKSAKGEENHEVNR